MPRIGKRDKVWAVMRVLREFKIGDICAAAEAQPEAVRKFMQQLTRAEVLKSMGRGKWRLAVDLGPIPPMFPHGGDMVDKNVGKATRTAAKEPAKAPRKRGGAKPLNDAIKSLAREIVQEEAKAKRTITERLGDWPQYPPGQNKETFYTELGYIAYKVLKAAWGLYLDECLGLDEKGVVDE